MFRAPAKPRVRFPVSERFLFVWFFESDLFDERSACCASVAPPPGELELSLYCLCNMTSEDSRYQNILPMLRYIVTFGPFVSDSKQGMRHANILRLREPNRRGQTVYFRLIVL